MDKAIKWQGSRVRLIKDYQDVSGLAFKAGQEGTALGRLDGHVLVDFDGYAEQRQARAVKSMSGSGEDDPVPWMAVIPAALLVPPSEG